MAENGTGRHHGDRGQNPGPPHRAVEQQVEGDPNVSTAVEPETPALVGVPEQPDAGADDEPAKQAAPDLWETGELDLSALSDPDSGLAGSSSLSGADAPLTSEPPLADATPLTSEQPLDTQLPLTAEPTGSALQSDDRGAAEITGVE